MTILRRIEILFSGHGTAFYGGEAITQTEHALQCAQHLPSRPAIPNR
ncbi:hypothetical protein ACU4GD_08235 [Cupriavidus basilensis]